jgi:hypothetical protein
MRSRNCGTLTLVCQEGPRHEEVLHHTFHVCNHASFAFGRIPKVHWQMRYRPTIYNDNAQTFHLANRKLTELWINLIEAMIHQSILLSAGNRLEVHRSTWSLVGIQCSVPPGGLQKVLGRSSMDEEWLNTILVSTEVELSSGPISQNDNEAVLTPVHFLVGEQLTTIPNGPESKRTDLPKEFKLQ